DPPRDVLEAMASELAELEPNPQVDPGWTRALEERQVLLPRHLQVALDPVRSGDFLVRSIAEDVLSRLPPQMRAEIDASIAIGGLLSGEMNAGIIRSPDRKYAVLIYSGLVIMLNKLLKIETAMARPGSVVYCNRMPAGAVTEHHLQAFRTELLDTYRTTRIPRGA